MNLLFNLLKIITNFLSYRVIIKLYALLIRHKCTLFVQKWSQTISHRKKQVGIFKIVRNTLTDATPLTFPHSLKNTARFPSIFVTCVSSRIVPTARSPKGWLGARSGASKCGNVVMPTVLVMGWMNITLAFICEGKTFNFSTTVFLLSWTYSYFRIIRWHFYSETSSKIPNYLTKRHFFSP